LLTIRSFFASEWRSYWRFADDFRIVGQALYSEQLLNTLKKVKSRMLKWSKTALLVLAGENDRIA
jgi:hypothetical protein